MPHKKQAAASALICADRRLLVRDALFLWMILLSAMRSRTATDCLEDTLTDGFVG